MNGMVSRTWRLRLGMKSHARRIMAIAAAQTPAKFSLAKSPAKQRAVRETQCDQRGRSRSRASHRMIATQVPRAAHQVCATWSGCHKLFEVAECRISQHRAAAKNEAAALTETTGHHPQADTNSYKGRQMH